MPHTACLCQQNNFPKFKCIPLWEYLQCTSIRLFLVHLASVSRWLLTSWLLSRPPRRTRRRTVNAIYQVPLGSERGNKVSWFENKHSRCYMHHGDHSFTMATLSRFDSTTPTSMWLSSHGSTNWFNYKGELCSSSSRAPLLPCVQRYKAVSNRWSSRRRAVHNS